MSKIAAIEYKRLPDKADKEDLNNLDNQMREKIANLERQLMNLRVDLQGISKLHDRVVKDMQKEKQQEVNKEKDEVSLIKKPLMGFKCANCERGI